MTDNIFQGTDQVQETQVATPIVTTTPEIPPELAEFVGVGKKYASLADAHKAFPHAQQHISTLEAENARIKAELEKRKTAEELLQDIQNGLTQKIPETTEIPSISANDISQLVRTEMERKATEDSAKQNQIAVVQEFTKKFGDKAQSEFEKIAAELGVPVTSLNQLASTSPKAVFKLAGIDVTPKNTQSGTIQSDVNLAATTTKSDVNSVRVALNGGAREDAAAIARARELIMKQYT
jgi:hypothetical protein